MKIDTNGVETAPKSVRDWYSRIGKIGAARRVAETTKAQRKAWATKAGRAGGKAGKGKKKPRNVV